MCGPYDLDLVNTSTELRFVTEAIVREKHAAVCLYGPPGTGKTAWAHHLAHRMGVPMRRHSLTKPAILSVLLISYDKTAAMNSTG